MTDEQRDFKAGEDIVYFDDPIPDVIEIGDVLPVHGWVKLDPEPPLDDETKEKRFTAQWRVTEIDRRTRGTVTYRIQEVEGTRVWSPDLP